MTTPLSDWTTLRVGGAPDRVVVAQSRQEIIEAVRAADATGEPLLILGGGSNLVVADEGVTGTVVAIRSRGITLDDEGCGGGWIEVEAGEDWDGLVSWSIEKNLRGMEALAGIPGSVGATPVQNVGAYGREVASLIARVTVLDRHDGQVRILPAPDCGFGYRWSMFKSQPNRWVILSVTFQMRRGDMSEPVAYAELAERLGIAVGECAPSAQVRQVVLDLRRAKGMVLDPDDHDTWSVGSFFVNPVIDPSADHPTIPDGAPRWVQPDGRVKTSAAWLVEHAGFPRGFRLPGSNAGVSTKHSLALTNRGGATAAEVVQLAHAISSGVRSTFGIDLVIEPTVIHPRTGHV